MIEVLLAHRWALERKALAERLSQEEDIHVAADIADGKELLQPAERGRAPDVDVNVVHIDLLGADGVTSASALSRLPRDSRILVLMDSSKASVIADALPELAPRLGFVSTQKRPAELAGAVRQAMRGELVLDPDLVFEALAGEENPLTAQERAILALAAEGAPPKDIARRLFLARGTVQNYLSRIKTKIGADSQMDAIRVAQQRGWLSG